MLRKYDHGLIIQHISVKFYSIKDKKMLKKETKEVT